MSKEKHCAQAHDIDGTLLLEGLNQYEAIQAARKTDPVAERVYNRLYDLYIRDGKASDLLARKYNPAKGADKAAFICMCFSHEFWNKLRKRQGQIARRKNHEVPLDAPSGGDIKVETEIRKDIARALQIEATEPSTGWVSAVCRSLPEGSPAYRLAELIRDGVAEAYAAKGLYFAGEDRHMEFTMAGKLLNLTKKQIERAKKQIAMALIRRPEATGMMERVKKSKKKRSESHELGAEGRRKDTDMFKLLPSQEKHAARLKDSIRLHGCALDASSPGAGKTYIACAVARELGFQPLIVTTKATIPSWQRTAEGFELDPVAVVNYESIRTGKSEFCTKYQREAYSRRKTSFFWNLPPGSMLIFDEVQKCRRHSSVNAQLLLAAARQQVPTLMCSATAFVTPMDCCAIGAALGLFRDGWFWTWASQHGCSKGKFGWQFHGTEADLRCIHAAIFPEKGSRLSLADIPEFPETRIEARPVETGKAKEIQAIYTRMRRELQAAANTEDREKLAELAEAMKAKKANQMTISLRARAAVELCKVDAIAELAEDAAAQGESVAIFVNFTETIDALRARLDCNAVIHGAQTPAERQQVVDDFQANRKPIVICNIAAGGVGISLHDPTGQKPRLALISPTFSAIDLTQALGRVHRAGGARSRQIIVFADGTCENRTCEKVAEKCSNIALLNDGDLAPTFLHDKTHEH